MNANIIRRLEMFIRVSKFGTESGLTFTTRGTALFGEINQSIASLQALGGDQLEGGGQSRSGTAERRAKAAFVDRGMPADFDVQLTTLLAEFDTATGRKYAGLQGQATGTNTMKVIAADGMRDVKELKAIVSNQLRKTNPGLLAAWNNASRLQRAPQSPESTAQTAPAPAGNP